MTGTFDGISMVIGRLFLCVNLILIGIAGGLGAAQAQSNPRPEQTRPPAAAPAEGLVRGWLQDIRATGVVVSTGAIAVDAGGDTVRISDFELSRQAASGPGSWSIRVSTVVLVGVRNAGGLFSIRAVSAKDLTYRVDDTAIMVKIASIDLDALEVPALLNLALDPKKPFTSLVAALRELTRVRVASARLGAMGVETRPQAPADASPSVVSTLSIDAIELKDARGSRIAEVRLGTVSFRTPGPDPARSDIAGLMIRNLEVGSLVRVLDPQSYVGARPDRPWLDFVGSLEIGRLVSISAGSELDIAGLSTGSMKIQLFPDNLAEILDNAMADPGYIGANLDKLPLLAAGILDSILIERLETRQVGHVSPSTSAAGVKDQIRFDGISVSGLTASRLEQVEVNRASVATANGIFSIDKAVVGRLTLPSPRQLIEAQRVRESGGQPDPLAMAPTVGTVKLEGVSIGAAPDAFSIGGVSLDLGYFIGAIPTSIKGRVANLKMPLSAVRAPPLRQFMQDFQYENLDVSLDIAATWNEGASEVDIEKVMLSLANAGSLTFAGALTNIQKPVLQKPPSLDELMDAVGARRLRLVYQDISLFSRYLAAIARVTKQSPADVRRALNMNMQAIMASIPDPAIRNRMIFAALAFLNDPKSLTIASGLNTAVQLKTILDTAANDPKLLPGMLRLDFSANRPQ